MNNAIEINQSYQKFNKILSLVSGSEPVQCYYTRSSACQLSAATVASQPPHQAASQWPDDCYLAQHLVHWITPWWRCFFSRRLNKKCYRLFILYFLLYPFNVFRAHFHEVRRLMTRFHWSLFCACSSCKFRLSSSSCIFLLQVFLGLPVAATPVPQHAESFPRSMSPPSHHMPEPP